MAIRPSPDLACVGLAHLSDALWEGPAIGRAGAGDQPASSVGTLSCGGDACAPHSLHSGLWFGSLVFFRSSPVPTVSGPCWVAPRSPHSWGLCLLSVS